MVFSACNYLLTALRTPFKTSEPRESFCYGCMMKCENTELTPQTRHGPRAELDCCCLAQPRVEYLVICCYWAEIPMTHKERQAEHKDELTSLLLQLEFHEDFFINLIGGLPSWISVCVSAFLHSAGELWRNQGCIKALKGWEFKPPIISKQTSG